MAIDFPNSPTSGQIFTVGDKSWIWDGTVWKAYGASLSPTVLKVDSTNSRVGINNQSPTTALDVTGVTTSTSFAQGTDYLTPYPGFRNRIINGDFRINQRAWSSSTATGTYGFDRWYQSNVGGTVTMSSQSFTVGSPAATGYEAPTFCRIVTASQGTTSDYAILSQVIEDVRTFANSTITISFWAKAASSTPKVAIEWVQRFGSGGSPSADVTAAAVSSVTLSSSWARYSVTMSIPNINGKTIGTTANTSSLALNLWVSAGTTFNSRASNIGIQNNTFDFWGVQVERGSVATPFEQRPIGAELALCQRYYETVFPSGVASSPYVNMTVTTNGYNEAVFYFKFAVAKRTTAYTVTGYRYDTGAANSWNWNKSGSTGTATPTFDLKSQYGFRGYIGSLGLLFGAVEVFPNWIVSDEF